MPVNDIPEKLRQQMLLYAKKIKTFGVFCFHKQFPLKRIV